MKKKFFLAALSFLGLNLLFSDELSFEDSKAGPPSHKTSIIGGGIIGALESYYAHLDALQSGVKIRITVYEKGLSFQKPTPYGHSSCSTNTSFNIVPCLTIDEILSVVPRGSELFEKLAILFSEPGGIRVDDVPGVNESESAVAFKKAVELYGNDPNHDDRIYTLLELGKMSINLWQDIYSHADDELKNIFLESNYNPCNDPKNTQNKILHDGYCIELIYGVPNAENRALAMKSDYDQLGYTDCKVLSPDEVIAIDASLTAFCLKHSDINSLNELRWKSDSTGIWKPGGCLDTRTFLPKFYTYLKKVMGTYTSESGKIKDCFRLKFNKEVTAIEYASNPNTQITGLKFSDGSSKNIDNRYTDFKYVFCPGEAVGTLHNLGFQEPAYAGFAGSSLLLNIPLSAEQLKVYKDLNHCMGIHKLGVILAWQARTKEDKIFIGVGGTKAFYGDQLPNIEDAFARNKHLMQLNIINDVLPDVISTACGYDTEGQELTFADIIILEDKGILQRWVGRRAVAYDGFPTLGSLYLEGRKVINARCTTHLGSGGVSFAPASVRVSRSLDGPTKNEFTEKVLRYADSRRHP